MFVELGLLDKFQIIYKPEKIGLLSW